MNVLVAGASGAIGHQLVPRLIAAGHHVAATTRQPAKLDELRQQGATPVLCDVLDLNSVGEAIASVAPEAIISQLTDLPQRLRPRQLKGVYAANDRLRLEGTANLLAAARGNGVTRFVMQSNAFWYQPSGGRVVGIWL